MTRDVVLEVCVETLEACLAAREGGAARLEVCSRLDVGGLTPSLPLLKAAIQSGLPVHGMIRPRAGNFVYREDELSVMARSVNEAKALGAAGVVFGVLRGDGTVDVERTRALVERARPMEITFHRAFDECVDLAGALEDVIAAGCDRVLTSGGEADVAAGAEALGRLVVQAAGRVEIAVGGGLRLKDAAWVARVTGARHFHGSLTEGGGVSADGVRRMVELLERA